MLMISRFLVNSWQMVVATITTENTSGGVFRWTQSPEPLRWVQENKAGVYITVPPFRFSLGFSTLGQFVHLCVRSAFRAITYH